MDSRLHQHLLQGSIKSGLIAVCVLEAQPSALAAAMTRHVGRLAVIYTSGSESCHRY